MTADHEISIPCILKIQLSNPRGYCGPAPEDDVTKEDYLGANGIFNDSLIIQTIREEIMSLKPYNFGACLKNQFSEKRENRGFFFDGATGNQYKCYEADLDKIRIVPLEVKTQITERKE